MRRGHPPLAAFVAATPETAAAFLRDWPLELLERLSGPPERIRYVANSLDAVSIQGGTIVIEGTAFDRASKPPAFSR